MAFQEIPAGADNNTVIALTNNLIRELNNKEQTTVFKGPNSVNTVINGKLPNSLGHGFLLSDSNNLPRIMAAVDSSNAPILKVSKDTFDVTSATNANLIFNSAQNVPKIVYSGSLANNFTAAGTTSSQQVTYTHNLGYTPKFIAVATLDQSLTSFSFVNPNVALPNTTIISTGAAGFNIGALSVAGVDSTTFYFKINWHAGLSAATYNNTCYFWLLQESFTS